jgi:hypothetical protein
MKHAPIADQHGEEPRMPAPPNMLTMPGHLMWPDTEYVRGSVKEPERFAERKALADEAAHPPVTGHEQSECGHADVAPRQRCSVEDLGPW